MPSGSDESWTELRPGFFLYGVALGSIFFAVAVAANSIFALFELIETGGDTRDWAVLILGPPLVLLFIYSAGYLLLVRIGFNDRQVRRRFGGQVRCWNWSQVERIERHRFYGQQLRLRDGSRVPVWEYLKGFDDLLFEADKRGISFEV